MMHSDIIRGRDPTQIPLKSHQSLGHSCPEDHLLNDSRPLLLLRQKGGEERISCCGL